MSAISKIWGGRSKARKALKGEGPRHGKTKKLCRQSLSKMQTNFCRQTLSRHVPPECRQRLSKMQTRALNFCRKCRQNYADKLCLESGRGRLHSCSSTQRCRGCLQRKCRQGLSTVFGGFFADKVCLQSLSTGLVCTIWECRQSLSTCLNSLSKAFCKVVCGNADKVCLEITSFSLFKYSIIEFSERKSSHPQRASPATSLSRAAAWLELTCTAVRASVRAS